MIRFAPAVASAVPPITSTPKPSIVPPKETDAGEAAAASGMLLSELPEISAPALKTSKRRSQRKPKAKPGTAAVQLDLNA
ncbi:hypothetical protein J2W52_005699 [Rhizobium miluonense]|uniref:Poly(Hydroxyalkanoate) granule-associated protein n=1 Tax=Rhizobium miluonense TaxID=411945 RepID=A0ABU1SYR7_9HYPH|nr:hypothetical protein [Rhizobium miluonense]